jgi:hypothetical protein
MKGEGRIILCLDKKWDNQNHALPKSWHDSDENGDLEYTLAKEHV